MSMTVTASRRSHQDGAGGGFCHGCILNRDAAASPILTPLGGLDGKNVIHTADIETHAWPFG
jgi:hypothetical protein